MTENEINGVTLTPGEFYHVQWEFPTGPGRGSFYGEYRYTREGEHTFWQPAQGRFITLKHGKRVTEVEAITPRAMLDRIAMYDKVRIHKYGGTYTGSVVGRGRTRVCVAFSTRGGKDKTQWIPVLEVEPVS